MSRHHQVRRIVLQSGKLACLILAISAVAACGGCMPKTPAIILEENVQILRTFEACSNYVANHEVAYVSTRLKQAQPDGWDFPEQWSRYTYTRDCYHPLPSIWENLRSLSDSISGVLRLSRIPDTDSEMAYVFLHRLMYDDKQYLLMLYFATRDDHRLGGVLIAHPTQAGALNEVFPISIYYKAENNDQRISHVFRQITGSANWNDIKLEVAKSQENDRKLCFRAIVDGVAVEFIGALAPGSSNGICLQLRGRLE